MANRHIASSAPTVRYREIHMAKRRAWKVGGLEANHGFILPRLLEELHISHLQQPFPQLSSRFHPHNHIPFRNIATTANLETTTKNGCCRGCLYSKLDLGTNRSTLYGTWSDSGTCCILGSECVSGGGRQAPNKTKRDCQVHLHSLETFYTRDALRCAISVFWKSPTRAPFCETGSANRVRLHIWGRCFKQVSVVIRFPSEDNLTESATARYINKRHHHLQAWEGRCILKEHGLRIQQMGNVGGWRMGLSSDGKTCLKSMWRIQQLHPIM